MSQLYVHLAPPEAIAAAVADPDPELGRGSVLAAQGLWHKVVTADLVRGTETEDESRLYVTLCKITQRERPDRLNELDFPPGAARCATCFKGD